jgi:hypothetical protein
MISLPRKLIIGALQRAMQRAWGVHGSTQVKDIGDNRFVVRFTREGDHGNLIFMLLFYKSLMAQLGRLLWCLILWISMPES